MNADLIRRVFATMEYGPAPEAEAPARAWLDRHQRRFGHFIGGGFVEPQRGERFPTFAPSRRDDELAQIAQGDAGDVEAAVKAASAALEGWQALSGHARAKYLYAIARHVQKHARLFAVLESLDNGKPLRESRDIDVPLVIRHFYHHAGWAQIAATELPDHRPIGVVGQIIPWNFPLLMLAWKVAPALAAGNTVVLKPAELTSLTALLFAEICMEVGLPPGALNIVTGDGRTGAAIVEHPQIAKIAFTGSTEVGRIIRRATAGSGKMLSLELGGKSPFVVFEDADLDSVVEGVVDAIWLNQGQVCCAGSRILVQESIADELLAKLRTRMETLRVGDPLDKSIDVGAIVSREQLARIEALVETGVSEGAAKWQPSGACPPVGCFYPPTILSNVSPSATVAQVEIFGPVIAMMPFRTHEEAIALANNTPYGLAASVWSESINLALEVAPRIKAGTVWINCSNVFDAASGFGGYRESGFGREGGREGLLEYLVYEPRPSQGSDKKGKPRRARAAGEPGSVSAAPGAAGSLERSAVDRTARLYVGGKHVRPDGGGSLAVLDPAGRLIEHVAHGNRKDIRNAVEAAQAASGWGKTSGHARAQVLYFLAENLEARADLCARVGQMTGDVVRAADEWKLSVERLFFWAAWADKHDGLVHGTPIRAVTLAMNEPVGVIGIVCSDSAPLLGLVSAIGPAIAMGNAVVVIPSERAPLAATDLAQVLATSDVPAGVVNIVTGLRDELAPVLAAHDAVESVWSFVPSLAAVVERESAGNMKRTFCPAHDWDFFDPAWGASRELLRHATQIKNVWVPYGE